MQRGGAGGGSKLISLNPLLSSTLTLLSSPFTMDAFSSFFLATSPPRLLQTTSRAPAPLPLATISAVRTEERPTSHTKPQKKTSTVTTEPKQKEPAENNKSVTINNIGIRQSPLGLLGSTARPRPVPSLAATLCNTLDYLINNFVDPPVLRPSVDPRHVLSDNFSPVAELPPTPCPVVRGSIPPCLAGGAYIRNGPNPRHLPRGPHHLFDGDGMLHSLLLPYAGGTAPPTFSSRFVRTYKYKTELEAGAPVLPSVFSGFHGVGGIARGAVTAARVLTGQMNPAEGVGLANTSLAFHAGNLYALGESDLPYAVHLDTSTGDISTIGRHDFDGKLFMGMTAHPKKDPITGEMFSFRYGPVPPYVTYFRFDPAGNKGPDVPIFSVTQPSFLHDFAITENYAIFPDIQIVMQPIEMLVGGGSPVGSDRGKIPRVGLLPRYAVSESEMRWFEVPGFNIIHALNAWEEEEGNVVVLVAPNVLSIEHALDKMELVHSSVEMVRIDLRSGNVSRTPLSAGNLDFGVINPGYVGRKNRYGYLGIGDPMPKICGVAKLDFEMAGKRDCEVARREFGPGCFGGEPFFVASAGEEEDGGYVVSYVHDERRGESRFVVMDAQSPELEIVAEVRLPRRVPYGFHGLFVSQAELQSQ